MSEPRTDHVPILLEALGIEPESFQRFLGWALAEHLVAALASCDETKDGFFSQLDAMKSFRGVLEHRTGRRWCHSDVEALYDRVKSERTVHSRKPIAYEEYLKLLWQVPLECAQCRRRPPDVKLHIDHVVPASRGGSSLRSNLQFLCAEHNLRKSNKREVTDPWLSFR